MTDQATMMRLREAYDKVKLWPETRMPGVDISTLGEGFTDLLALRNVAGELLSAREPEQRGGITHAEFSRQASYLAKEASDWAGDVLMLPENISEPMREGVVARFLEGMRGRLDIIEDWGNAPETPSI